LILEPDTVSHLVPLIIKVTRLILSHISIQILLPLFVTESLFDNLPSLVIKHALVRHFLQTSACIFVHLVPLGNFLAVGPYCTFGVRLENLLNRSAVFSDCG
jgi:hypothetical protein